MSNFGVHRAPWGACRQLWGTLSIFGGVQATLGHPGRGGTGTFRVQLAAWGECRDFLGCTRHPRRRVQARQGCTGHPEEGCRFFWGAPGIFGEVEAATEHPGRGGTGASGVQWSSWGGMQALLGCTRHPGRGGYRHRWGAPSTLERRVQPLLGCIGHPRRAVQAP